MGWDALERWGPDAVRLEKLTGGVANDVWRVRVNGQVAVARLGRRSDADLAWEADLLQHLDRNGRLIDVRSPDEYKGIKLHMPEYPQEGALRGGHIPTAKNVPWARAVNPDTGEFKSAEELRTIYEKEQGLKADDDVIAYCRIGERSSHTWFVLTYLLGYNKVRNYDGSWTEWGNSVRVPIETGPGGTV